jgi:DNA-binding transcriptional ArsR family regulator
MSNRARDLRPVRRYPARTPRRPGFVSLDRLALRILVNELGHQALGLLVDLISRAEVETGIVKMSIRRLAEELVQVVSRKTLSKYLRQLESAGQISIARGFNDEEETQIQVLKWAWLLALDVDPETDADRAPIDANGSGGGAGFTPPLAKFTPPVTPPHHSRPAVSSPLDTRDTQVQTKDRRGREKSRALRQMGRSE